MALKFYGVDATGNRVALTRLTGGSIRILTDRIVVGHDIFQRNWDTWGHVDGKPPSFVEVVAQEEEQAAPAPTPIAREEKTMPAKADPTVKAPAPVPSPKK